MKIRDIVNAFTDKRHDASIMDLEIFIVTSTETFDATKYPANPDPQNPKIQSAMLDGATLVTCRPIEGIVFGGPDGGMMAFVDPRKETEKKSVFMVNAEAFPGVAICGKPPTALKW